MLRRAALALSLLALAACSDLPSSPTVPLRAKATPVINVVARDGAASFDTTHTIAPRVGASIDRAGSGVPRHQAQAATECTVA